MSQNLTLAAPQPSPLCRVFNAMPLLLWQEGFPLHRPHALPGPILSEHQNQDEATLPPPAVAVTLALEGVPSAEWGPHAAHTLHLALPADEDTLEVRVAALQEFSELLVEMADRGILCRFVVISTPADVYGTTVIRHAPVAVLDPDSEEPLWVHPSAEAFDLLDCPFPDSQWARKLGESAPEQEWGDFSHAPLLDPATGLPGWAAMMLAALARDRGRPVPLGEALEAVVVGLRASGQHEPGFPWRARATAQVEAARHGLFGEGPPDQPDGLRMAQAASSTSAR